MDSAASELTKKQAIEICGTLSNTSKMPGLSTSLPASKCKAGAKLAQIPGSICHGCYALKGRYNFPNVQNALTRRLEGITHPRWVEAMTTLIRESVTIGVPYFRFFDSGDLQSEEHLKRIIQVCNNLPEVSFWLPTRENAVVKAVSKTTEMPANLVIRISATMVGEKAPKWWPTTSTVVVDDTATCQAPQQGGECKSCRACWDPEVANISYHKH